MSYFNHLYLHLITICFLFGSPCGLFAQSPEFNKESVFDEVASIVQQEFFNAEVIERTWEQIVSEYRPKALAAVTHDEFANVVNEMLSELGTSHTAYFPSAHPKRYQIFGIFSGLASNERADLLEYGSIGIDVEVVDGKTFARSVYDGWSAARSGIRFGDEIVSVDGQPFHPVFSFKDKKEVEIEIRRLQNTQTEKISVPVERLNGRTMFEKSLEQSVRKFERDGRSIGYVHVWSYAGSKYQDKLREILLFGELASCDALVLDLRDGWGGASLEYLNLFREPIAMLQTQTRSEPPVNYSGVWGKPVALLINRRSTSGKELFAYGFKKLQLGEVIGETTAGAVVAGKGNLLSNGDVLYVAVADLQIDGRRLERVGVPPTIQIDRPIPYANGADPQLEKAIEVLGR